MNATTRLGVGSLLLLGLPCAAVAQPMFTITNLGSLAGPPSAMHVTSAGLVVGFAPSGDAAFRAVRFGPPAQSLGAVADFSQSVALTADDVGNVFIGGYTLGGLAYGGAVVGALPEPLGPMLPCGVNQNGVVVGLTRATTSDGLLVDRACMVAGGLLSTLPTLGGIANSAFGINDAGLIVGASLTSTNTRPHACLWLNGVASDLGVLGSPTGGVGMSEARAINAARVAVGASTLANGSVHACAWTLDATGAVIARIDLGTLQGGSSYARAINAGGDVVGVSDGHAFLAPAGSSLLDLNALLPTGAGWRLDCASSINDAGQIVGWGTHNGWPAAFLLTPVSACGPADIAAVGGVTSSPGSPDGQLTLDDIIVFINLFSDSLGCPGTPASACSRADLCAVGGPPLPPDGQLTLDDILMFVNAFGDGC